MKSPNQLTSLAVIVGLLLVVAGTAMPIFHVAAPTWKYAYCAGALLVVIGRLFMPYKGDNLRLKRLCRIEVWAGLMFIAAGFFMFYPGAGPTDWLAFTLAGAALQVFTSIMIPRVARKEASKN